MDLLCRIPSSRPGAAPTQALCCASPVSWPVRFLGCRGRGRPDPGQGLAHLVHVYVPMQVCVCGVYAMCVYTRLCVHWEGGRCPSRPQAGLGPLSLEIPISKQ